MLTSICDQDAMNHPSRQQVDATLDFGNVIAEPNQPIRKVYFPFSGVISLVVPMGEGDMIETAMVGRDGVAKCSSLLKPGPGWRMPTAPQSV